MKFILLLLLVPATLSAQCPLTLDQSPTIRGLKLGIPGQALEEMFLQISMPFGKIRLPGFEDVEVLNLELDRHDNIRQINITYDFSEASPIRFRTTRAFAKNVSKNLNLPFKAWRFKNKNTAVMQCKEFRVVLESWFFIAFIDTRKPFKP